MAVLYDFIEVVGGAECLTIELANSTEQSIIVAGVNYSLISKLPIIEVPHHSIAKLTSLPLWKSIKTMHAFRNIDVNLFRDDVNLFSGNYAPLAVYNSPAKKNYYYCHTPPRFIYDLYEYYQKKLPWYQRIIVDLFAQYLKAQYEPALKQMDSIFCNSKNVQHRIKKYLGYDAEVIYPPISTEKFFNKPNNGYYLSTARLEDYKRVELIVEAFLQMPNKRLIVVSGGSLLTKLRIKTAQASNIEVIGWVDEGTLLNYVAECIATIYIPIDEDFGISPVESMAAGKPVIGVNDGGLKETILHQQTGWLCPCDIKTEDIIDAVHYMSINCAADMKVACGIQAMKFSPHHFHQRMKGLFTYG